MSYDKVIGFGIDPNAPKERRMVGLSAQESEYFNRMGVEPIFHDLKKRLPEGNKEPEPKMFVRGTAGFKQIRHLITSASNAFIIPNQIYQEKNPLTSILVDTVEYGAPTARLDDQNYTLRYRFECCAKSGMITQGDFNEKSGMKTGNIIGGIIDRTERELEQREGESIESGYRAFQQKYRKPKHKGYAACDQIPFEHLYVGAGYQAARNEIGIAFKPPGTDVLVVAEVCEDFWHATQSDLATIMAKFHEFEFEPKQVWGKLPNSVNSKQAFKHFLYSSMNNVIQYLHVNTPRSSLNMLSKAEITKEHLGSHYDLGNDPTLFSGVFGISTPINSESNAFRYSLMSGSTLKDTIQMSAKSIHDNGARLFAEKTKFNNRMEMASMCDVGHGNSIIRFENDNIERHHPAPVAAYL